MTFAYPILLGGLLLAGLPVLVHFLAGQKPKILPFPAFRFLMQKRQTNTRRLRLRHLLLMLLRMTLIVLICVALARPRLFHESLGLSRERLVAMILIFDTSPSMGYKIGDQTLLDLAKKRALELLDHLPPDGRYLILDTGNPNRASREDFLPTLDKARQRIGNLELQPTGSPVSPLIADAIRRFDAWDDPAGQTMPRFVCTFTDRTTGAWDRAALASLQRLDDAPKVQTLLFDVGVAQPSDVAIVDVAFAAGRATFVEGACIELRATVQATGSDVSDTFQCRVGEKTLEQAFALKAGERRTLAFSIDTLEWKLTPGWHSIEVKFPRARDTWAHNDVRFATFRLDARPSVLVLSDDPKRTEPMAKALESLLYHVARKKTDDAVDLTPYRGVFLVSVAAPSEKLMRSLSDYVVGGGAVCVVPGDKLDTRAYWSEPARAFLPGRFGESVVSPTRKAGWNLGRSDLRHPFLRLYVAWMAGDNVDYLLNPRGAWRYWTVLPTEPDQVIVRYDDALGQPAVLGTTNKAGGRVLLLTTPMDDLAFQPVGADAWNDYGESVTSFYIALTSLCARYLIAQKAEADAPAGYVLGNTPPMVARVPGFTKFTRSWTGGSEEIRFDENDRWIGDRLTRVGQYGVTASDAEKQISREVVRFSMNIAASESDLTRVPIDEIERLLGKDAVIAQERHTPILETLNDRWDEPIELFPWLMIALLFALALENLLANRFYRRPSEPGASATD